MIWLAPVTALVLLFNGPALAYVIGAATVIAFLATDNGRYLAIRLGGKVGPTFFANRSTRS